MLGNCKDDDTLLLRLIKDDADGKDEEFTLKILMDSEGPNSMYYIVKCKLFMRVDAKAFWAVNEFREKSNIFIVLRKVGQVCAAVHMRARVCAL